MGYDAWKQDYEGSISEREALAEHESYVREALAEWTPRYRLHVFYDPFLVLTTARLNVQLADRTWRTLDESTVSGDDAYAAISCMRQFRRLARGVL